MAYAVKYIFSWQSTNGTDREIRVLKDGHTGDPIRRALGRGPILKKQKSGTVCGTSLEFYPECAVDGEFAEFYTSDPKAYRVELYAGNTLLWTGYVTPELYSEPDVAPPYDVQVVATDGIGELKLYDFTAQGTVTLRALLGVLLAYTGLSSDVNLISSLKPGSGGAGSLLSKSINLDFMAGKSCYEVLTYILDTLHATITWYRGAWLITRETNVTMTSGKVRYFNTSGNSALFAGSSVMIGGAYDSNAWPVGNLTQIIDPAKKSVTIQAPWHPVRGLENPDMDRDASWTKNSGATFASSPGCFSLPYLGVNAQGLACIKQDLQMAGIRVPLSLSLKGTGLGRIQYGDPRTPDWTNGFVGVVLVYTVGQTHYILRSVEDGLEWREGALPNFDLFYWQQPGGGEGIPTKSFDSVLADRIGAEVLTVENIPTFDQSGSFPAGVLTVYIAGLNCYLYGAELNVVLPKGYKDRLHLDNGARGEGEEIEVAIGRETSALEYYKNFLQGILLDDGALITSFSDANFTTSLDFLSFIARDYALSRALPRLKQTGKLYLESGVDFPPLVFTKGALDYWLETYAWDLYEDEVEVSALSLPGGTLTVQGETISEAGGTASSSGASSAGGGSSSMAGVGTTVNFFEQDADYSGEVKLKAGYNGLRIPGLRLGAGASALDLEVVTIDGTRYLHTPLSFYSDGQLSGGGLSQSSPGGGGGLDPDLMWKYLTNDPTLPDNQHANDKIAAAHLPDLLAGSGLRASYSGNLYLNLSLNFSEIATGLGGIGEAASRGVASSIGAGVAGLTPGSLIQSVLGDGTWDSTNTVKAFVNSSIATATATFRGTNTTATTEAQFLAWANALTHDMNDYVFWATTDSSGNTVYKRYKYDGTNWVFEYDLNNSSFTAAQWSAINSGVTATKVGTFDTIASYFSNGLLSAAHVGDLSGTYLPRSAGSNYPLTGDLYMGSHAITGLTTINGVLDIALTSTYTKLTGKSLRITDGASSPAIITIGQWDGVYNRVETSGRPFYLTSFSQPIYIGREGQQIDITLDISGNVAIGANSSSYKLYVNGTFNATTIYQNGVALGTRAFDSTDYLPIAGGNMTGAITPAAGQSAIAWSASSLTLSGAISGASNIDSLLYFNTTNSRVGVNTSSPQSTFDVAGQINTNYRITIGGGLTIGWWDDVNNRFESYSRPLLITSYSHPIKFGINGNGDALFIGANSYVGVNNADPQYALDVTGIIHATTGIFTEGYLSGGGLSQSSDRRLKTALKDYAYTPALLMSIRPREWDWNGKAAMKGHAAGFVAQEIEGPMPYAVDNAREYKALFYDHFHALEVAALQDHETRLAAIEKENEAIRKDNVALRLENRQLRERLNMN